MKRPPSLEELFLAHSSPVGWAVVAEGIPSQGRLYRYSQHIHMLNAWATSLALARANREHGRKRVLLSCPPRHSKSTTVSQWLPAWWLGHYPNDEVAVVCATTELADEHSGRSRDIMNAHGVRHFGLRVQLGKKAGTNWRIEDHKGRCHAVGTGGTFVGKGAHLMVVDDPIKDAQQAYSSHQREMLWRWWTNVASTRLNPGGVCLVTATRWHSDDLTGRLLENAPGDWELLNLAALAGEADPLGREPGEALWPEMYDAAHHQAKRRQDPYVFAAQYQGDPTPTDGAVFRRERFRYARDGGDHLELLEPLGGESRRILKDECLWFICCDMANRTSERNDYTVATVFARTPANA